MVVGLKFLLCWFKQEPSSGGINSAIGITNFVGCFTGTVARHDDNNNGWDASTILGAGKNILARDKVKGRIIEFLLCRVDRVVVTGSKECPACLVFLVTFF